MYFTKRIALCRLTGTRVLLFLFKFSRKYRYFAQFSIIELFYTVHHTRQNKGRSLNMDSQQGGIIQFLLAKTLFVNLYHMRQGEFETMVGCLSIRSVNKEHEGKGALK